MEGTVSPAPGDASMCLHCSVILIYEPDLTVRAATAGDIAKMPRSLVAQLAAMQLAQRLARETFPAKPESEH
jgi:hypothetical protein